MSAATFNASFFDKRGLMPIVMYTIDWSQFVLASNQHSMCFGITDRHKGFTVS